MPVPPLDPHYGTPIVNNDEPWEMTMEEIKATFATTPGRIAILQRFSDLRDSIDSLTATELPGGQTVPVCTWWIGGGFCCVGGDRAPAPQPRVVDAGFLIPGDDLEPLLPYEQTLLDYLTTPSFAREFWLTSITKHVLPGTGGEAALRARSVLRDRLASFTVFDGVWRTNDCGWVEVR